MYVDYYSEFIDTHTHANNAYSIASSKTVSAGLINNVTELEDVISACKINQDADNVILAFNQNISEILINVDLLEEFAESYKKVETAYTELKEQLDTLKEKDKLYKEKVAAEPLKSDNKYYAKVNGEYVLNISSFNTDYYNWTVEVNDLKYTCKRLNEYIMDYITYIGIADMADPSNGTIDTGSLELPIINTDDTYALSEPISNSYILSGEELEDFLKGNNVPNEDYISVEKCIANLNGIPVVTYMVYDNATTEEEREDFVKFANKCLKYESKIDDAVLAKIFTGDDASGIVFKETVRCETAKVKNNKFSCVAYYKSKSKNIIMFNNAYKDEKSNDYYSASIIHETGHAYDHALLGGAEAISNSAAKLKTTDVNEGNAQLFTYDENNQVYTWDRLVDEEAIYFDASSKATVTKTFDSKDEAVTYYNYNCKQAEIINFGQSTTDQKWQLEFKFVNPVDPKGVTFDGIKTGGYNVNDYVSLSTEYFADAFQAYWLGEDITKEGETSRLEFLCPKTYDALNNLFTQDKISYNGGNN